MDPINHINRITELLKRQLSETKSASHKLTQTTTESVNAGKLAVSELQLRIKEKIRQIDPNDQQKTQKAIRIFLESVLSWEFGEQLINDPHFFALLDKVQDGIQGDASSKKDLENLVAQLAE